MAYLDKKYKEGFSLLIADSYRNKYYIDKNQRDQITRGPAQLGLYADVGHIRKYSSPYF